MGGGAESCFAWDATKWSLQLHSQAAEGPGGVLRTSLSQELQRTWGVSLETRRRGVCWGPIAVAVMDCSGVLPMPGAGVAWTVVVGPLLTVGERGATLPWERVNALQLSCYFCVFSMLWTSFWCYLKQIKVQQNRICHGGGCIAPVDQFFTRLNVFMLFVMKKVWVEYCDIQRGN